jgi:hypothetical protein
MLYSPAMDDIDLKERQRITAAEMARRQKHVHRADAANRLQGATRSPASEAIFAAYIRGEIGVMEIIPRLKALHRPR